MQRIKKLSSLEAQKIAAGEVVERPANVVKELVENSIDAGATAISIYIKRGGHKEIQVIDNGCGMSSEDAHLCFEHHATSKISSLNDLYSIESYGFRGEALSSIAAVSKISLQTKEPEAELGLRLERAPEKIIKQESIGSNNGTSITISDIFFNVPARQKFLKKAETEWRQIVTFFQAMCLAHQSIHFKLFHDESLIYNAPPTKTLHNRFAQIASLNSDSLLKLDTTTRSGVTISGIVSDAHTVRYNKNQMFFFVNSRWVKNYKLAQAALKGYSGSLPTNKFPLCALMIEVDPSKVDVNIHPRKEEVQFLHPQQVQSLIIEQTAKALQTKVSRDLNTTKQSNKSVFTNTFSHSSPSKPFNSVFAQPTQRVTPPSDLLTEPEQIESLQLTTPQQVINKKINEDIIQQQATFESIDYTVVGVAHKTYIMLEHKDGILFVDQHAAHERVLFERFSKQSGTREAISLISPILITISYSKIQLLEQYTETFGKHGIEMRVMGDNQIGITSTPVYANNIDWHSFIHELIELIQEESAGQENFISMLHNKILAELACKAAVKAGDSLTMTQIHQLLDDLEQCEHKNICAHGRPTSWLLQEYELKKKFKRDYR